VADLEGRIAEREREVKDLESRMSAPVFTTIARLLTKRWPATRP
jgi:hypothetical protein